MAKFQGKRMVPESLIAKIGQGGGTEYTAGEGIDITNNEISANIKAGSGIVVDTDLTDESLVVMVDQEDIPYKSDLATVATTGDYDDLTNKPTIPEAPLVLTQATGTLSDADYAKLDQDTVIQYTDNGVTRLYYFYSDTTTQIEYRTNPIFTSSTTGNAYRFIVTKADKTYGLNYSLGYNLLPTMTNDGNFKLTASRSGSTVTSPAWKLDYPDPDTTAAGSYNLEATVDAQGGITYDWTAGGGTPSNMVTTDTAQNITGVKTFRMNSYGLVFTGPYGGNTAKIGGYDGNIYMLCNDTVDQIGFGTWQLSKRALIPVNELSSLSGNNHYLALQEKIAGYGTLPDTTTDGTYVLKATVSSGVVTYA